MSGDLSQRLSVTARDDEFDEISTKLNQMLNRIEDLMNSMQQVTNNVAHDLRSPLTRLRNRLEVTLLEERNSDVYQSVMGEAIGDADSLIQTFNAMLSIARLEAGIDSAQWSETNIGDLMSELAELYQAVADEEEELLTFDSDIQSNPRFHCNRHLIGQAVTNLLDNAIKYTPDPSAVKLSVSGNDQQFSITVSDNGPGIPEHERERVFERFVRLENERNTPGNGLGLSLVQAVVRLHSAHLVLEDNNPGLKVTINFVKKPVKELRAAKQNRIRA
jgi:signal transduction histidine kinase